MDSRFKIITTFVLFLNSLIFVSQHKEKQIELSHLRINGENIPAMLDAIVSHEKKCDYYEDKLVLSINIKKADDKYFISIQSQNDINLLLPLDSYGYIYHQNHLFIIQGDQCEVIFSSCGEKRTFSYIDYNHIDFQVKKGRRKKIYVFNDDSFSQWHYWYTKNEFVLEEKSTSCI